MPWITAARMGSSALCPRRASLALALALACSGADPGDASSDGASTTTSATTSTDDATTITATSTSTFGQDLGDMSSETASSTTGPDACDGPAPCGGCTCVADIWECACPPLAPEAGFIDVDPAATTLGVGDGALAYTSSAARLFYAFRPADDDPYHRPLVVLFNGGPAVSSGLLLGLNTGPWTIAEGLSGGPPLAANSSAWTAIGNLLYIDARAAGFSYGLAAGVSDVDVRALEMRPRNFNPYLDAADFVRVLLGFWRDHPALREAPVVIVAESYGGVRAGILLDMMLAHGEYDGGDRPYRDPALVAAIDEHLRLRFADADEFPAALVAEQFGRQVLIQPSLAGVVQKTATGALFEGPGSPIEALAGELGVDFVPCAEQGPGCVAYDNGLDFVRDHGRSVYDVHGPASWLDDLFDHTATSLSDPALLGALLGVSPSAIVGLAGPARGRDRLAPYRLVAIDDAPTDAALGGLGALLGPLEPWDRYFMIYSREANINFRAGVLVAQDVDADDAHHGRTFLSNLVHVDTLITRAEDDVAIAAAALPATLAAYPSLVADARLELESPRGAARPGAIVVTYRDAALPGLGAGEVRTIRAPAYAGASHAVTLDAPAAILADVTAWLAESSATRSHRDAR